MVCVDTSDEMWMKRDAFRTGAEWMLEKAIERYSSELDDFINLLGFLKKKTAGLIDKEKSIENFRKAMQEE